MTTSPTLESHRVIPPVSLFPPTGLLVPLGPTPKTPLKRWPQLGRRLMEHRRMEWTSSGSPAAPRSRGRAEW